MKLQVPNAVVYPASAVSVISLLAAFGKIGNRSAKSSIYGEIFLNGYVVFFVVVFVLFLFVVVVAFVCFSLLLLGFFVVCCCFGVGGGAGAELLWK